MGLSGRVPARVDQATKAGLLDLLEQATGQGWTVRAACQVLQVNELRVYRWLHRRAAGELKDRAPGGRPMHGLLDWEVTEIIELFDEWGEVDRSHRKLAHRGSYLERGVGLASQRAPRAGAPGPAVAAAAAAGPLGTQAVP